ncbi:hypothetical protein SBF1_4990001 [Candidatus Desulfosporosinus infrequens]|uniref:Uncharacterized protein n=1 Tax=Candidatus Desulfosporosinus infrequens TaxID=2043169 RepID=A0A2U3LGM8_9FIRM|nr:hypothetical protein SBF1_4990001 [Candidatus Desulfosporosinus infrequens]
MDDELKSQIKRFVTMLELMEDDVELTESESNFLKWLSSWDQEKIDNFISIVKKARKKQ